VQIYNYNRETKEYIGTSEARLDPLEWELNKIERWLLPAYATFEVPPECPEGKMIVMDDGQWTLVDIPEPPAIPEISPKTNEQLMAEIVAAVQLRLDTTAQQKGYDNIFTLISYVDSTNPTFQAEGQAGLIWRDACWVKCLEIKNAVLAETRPMPTVEQVLSEMPVFAWPE